MLELDVEVALDTSLSVDAILVKLHEYFRDQSNDAVRRWEFSCCRQEDGESFSAFYVRLQLLADEVDLCFGTPVECRARQLVHSIILGVKDNFLRQRLLELKTSTHLKDVVALCRSREVATNTSKDIQPIPQVARKMSSYQKNKKLPPPSTSTVSTGDAASGYQQRQMNHDNRYNRDNRDNRDNWDNRDNRDNRDDRNNLRPCFNCGIPHEPFKCLAANSKCFGCGKMGHFHRCCKPRYHQSPATPIHMSTQLGASGQARMASITAAIPEMNEEVVPSSSLSWYDDDIPYVSSSVRAVAGSTPVVGPPAPCISVTLSMCGKSCSIRCVPDTGSDISVMSVDVLRRMGLSREVLTRHPDTKLWNPDGTSLASEVVGAAFVWLTYGCVSFQGWVTFLSNLPCSLLSWRHCQRLHIVSHKYPAQLKSQMMVCGVGRTSDPYNVPVIDALATHVSGGGGSLHNKRSELQRPNRLTCPPTYSPRGNNGVLHGNDAPPRSPQPPPTHGDA